MTKSYCRKTICGIGYDNAALSFYQKLAAYGHMGREELGVGWEKTDRTEALKAALKG